MDVEELRDIVVSCIVVFLPKRRSYRRGFLLDEGSLVGDGLYAHEIMLSVRAAAPSTLQARMPLMRATRCNKQQDWYTSALCSPFKL